MDEKTMSFNESQLKRTGFAEAFTPQLKNMMEQGVPLIQYNIKKEYEGDKVDAILHLKKSATSDYYFLNKFDLQLQKDGQVDSLKQTFYLTRKPGTSEDGSNEKQKHENKYTLKEGYNLLAGRPVYKNLVGNEGQEYQAWVKIDFKNVLNNGNYELKQYHSNYGFELENVLAKYSIKELMNDQYKQSLIESLQRGNLQKATFVDQNGKEEKLYVSPNITLGSLNVYDANKQRITTEALVEKNYIGEELSKQLKQRMNPQQKKEQSQTQESVQKQEPPATLKTTQKHKNEEPKKKQSRKQKVN
jgi:hypothetical protein